MTTRLDTRMRAAADRLVSKFGKTVTFIENAVSDYDPATRTVRKADRVSHSVKVSPPEPFKTVEIDGDKIRMSDMKTLLPAKDLAFTPTTSMIVEFESDSDAWRVHAVRPLYSGDLITAYELQLRQ